MRLPRPGLIPLSAALLLASSAASANPIIIGQTLQCDGTYANGPGTHMPAALLTSMGAVQAQVQDATTGLRIGTARMGIVAPGNTRALWRFDVQATVAQKSCVADAVTCPTNGFCAGYAWTYADPNNSSPMTTGSCIYDQPCGGSGSLISGVPPIGLGSCPATTPAVGASTIFPADGTNHFPSYPGTNSVATFNGTTQFSSVTYSAGTWDLGATYTLSAWFKTASAASMRILSEQGPTGYWGFGVNGGGVRRFDSRDTGHTSRDQTVGAGLNDGNWHQIHVVRRNGLDVRFYADGVLLSANTDVASTTSFQGYPLKHPVMIGMYEGGPPYEFFNGTIDEIRVTDAAMNDDDVYLEFNGSVRNKYSNDGGATFSQVAGSFAGGPVNGDQLLRTYTPAGAYSASAQWIFEAQSTQSASTVLTALVPVIDTGKPIAPTPSGTPTTTNDITWSWGAPAKVCPSPGTGGGGPYYQLIDAVSGAAITAPGTLFYPATSIGENVPGSPNQLRSRLLILTDVWGTSSLSASATAYTLAATPTGMFLSSISSGSFVVNWGAAGNPGYTRYEVTYAQDPAFTVGLTTAAALSSNLTSTSLAVNGLSTGTTYYLRVRSFNGRASDPYGGVGSAFLTGTVVTRSGAPALAGAPQSTTQIQWSWSSVPGAVGYNLYDSPTLSLMFGGAALAFSTSPLSVNTRYDAEVEAVMPAPTPASPRGHAFTYTLASPPTAPAVAAVFATSATVSWSANGNPAGTFYQVIVASDAAFNVIVATVSVSTTSAMFTGLLPGGTYYSKVQAINGVQIPTAFAAIPQLATAADPRITSNGSPNSPYVATAGLVGAWQFDEATGTFSLDGSTYGDQANLVCFGAACASTPTWTSGPPGLGSALSFNGLSGAAVTASGTPFSFTDSLTVEAWVNPATASQQNGAGIVGRGNAGSEDFALDVTNGKYRFIALPSQIAASPSNVSPGVWTHLVGVYDSVAQTAALYVNGVAAASVGAAAPPRNNSGQPLSIGNRNSALGQETLGFSGMIDSVRVLHRALSAAEVLADYQGGFVSSVTAPAPNAGVIVALPPNAFGAPAQILISGDPVGHPIRIPAAALSAGLAALPSGLVLVPNSLTEVVPIVNGLPFTAPLGSSATLSIPYVDNGNNVIVGTNPPLAASTMRMYTLNTTVNRWELLPTSVDTVNKRATGVTPHFSVFALFAPVTIGAGLSGVRAYPVPWKPGTGGRFDAPGVTFSGLPTSGTIRILDLAGRRVREFAFSGAAAGSAVWDGQTDAGRRCAGGVYFAKVSSGGASTLLKIAIER